MMELQSMDSPEISEMDIKIPELKRHKARKCTSQYYALFYKSITIQKKNVCTNICQVLYHRCLDSYATHLFAVHLAHRVDGRG